MNGRRLTATMGLWVLLVTALLAEKTNGQPPLQTTGHCGRNWWSAC
jgi:hypothetical protein